MGERAETCCKETKKLTVAYLTGTLGRDGRTYLVNHMRACPHCWKLVGELAKGSTLPYTWPMSMHIGRKVVHI